jgi:hypothetical protein
MLEQNNRALKEWATVCDALGAGRQILLIRKGGIREEGGAFAVDDPEFFLLPTFEHQNAGLLKAEHQAEIAASAAAAPPYGEVRLGHYAVVDTVLVADDEEALNDLSAEYIWNEQYVRQRCEFNAYDPLYVLLLRVYRLAATMTLPMRPAYEGCKSWVTLEAALPTAGAVPALGDAEYARRRDVVLRALEAR